jgi:hypothetical protein
MLKFKKKKEVSVTDTFCLKHLLAISLDLNIYYEISSTQHKKVRVCVCVSVTATSTEIYTHTHTYVHTLVTSYHFGSNIMRIELGHFVSIPQDALKFTLSKKYHVAILSNIPYYQTVPNLTSVPIHNYLLLLYN